MNFVFKGKECLKKLGSGQKPQELSQLRLKKKKNRKIKTKRPKAHAITKRCVFLHSQKNLYIQRTHPTVYSVPNHLISKTKMVFLCHTYGNERNTF